MFNVSESKKGTFLEQTKAAREERALEKRRDEAVYVIQAHVRGWLCRLKYTKKILEDLDNCISEEHNLKPSLQIYATVRRFLPIWRKERDKERFSKLCKYLVGSLGSESPKISYVGVFLSKEHSVNWIRHTKEILWKCCIYLDELQPEYNEDTRLILIFLHTLVAYTSTNTWVLLRNKTFELLASGMKQLCANLLGHLFQRGHYIILQGLLVRGLTRVKISLKQSELAAIMTLVFRPLVSADFTEKLMSMFLIHVFSVPALLAHLQSVPECLALFVTHGMLERVLDLLSLEQCMRIVFNTLEGNYALCLLANLVHLAYVEKDGALPHLCYPRFTDIVTKLIQSCQNYVVSKQSNLTHWHPILGWFAQPMDPHLHTAITHVKPQLALLWSAPIITLLLGNPLCELAEFAPALSTTTEKPTSIFNLRKSQPNQKQPTLNFSSLLVRRIILTCNVFEYALNTFTQLKLDVLTGLVYQGKTLFNLWVLMCAISPLRTYTEHLTVHKEITPEMRTLQLFCECMTHYITILDDVEMYETQFPFALAHLMRIGHFVNNLAYKMIVADQSSGAKAEVFVPVHGLLSVLYRRDSWRPYAPAGHWLVREVRTSVFLADLEKGRKVAHLVLQKMPHVISHEERVRLFRRNVATEKAALGVSDSTLVTVHRRCIVEDGYRQLALLPAHALKSVVRVRFVNEQGLDEAGIDQDGVFKEFLEETIKRVFDPGLNLFRATADERLYPSPTSYLHEGHLQLFEFVGRMLGKAVYEGIVVDVPFASFFLSQVLGQTSQALYSCMDELPSLDEALYKSLTFVKHHTGDVRDLELTFSVDDDLMGRLVTHELIPGGRAVPVTNENRINYIHLMAHFRMMTQIKDQTASFIKGFRSIVNPDWLALFSTPELQRLISGDNVPLDLKDLRRHTHYYGGFHDSHRVVGWLWDVLDKDFSEQERAMFLKFVTSCSKPPLLGFAHLEPPFSIRCVEVGDDEDTGDTIGSVIRGFFTIRKRDPLNRLPTSSTCFNLLKLPNYQKKSTLRDKLRYAVTSNTGFELS